MRGGAWCRPRPHSHKTLDTPIIHPVLKFCEQLLRCHQHPPSLVGGHASMGRIPIPAAICRCRIHSWCHQPGTHAHPRQLTQHRTPHLSSLNSYHSVPHSCIPHIGISQLSDPLDRAPSGAACSRQRHDYHQRRLLLFPGDLSPIAGGAHSRDHHSSGNHHPNRPYPGRSFSVVPRCLHAPFRKNAAAHRDNIKRRSLDRHGATGIHPRRNCS